MLFASEPPPVKIISDGDAWMAVAIVRRASSIMALDFLPEA